MHVSNELVYTMTRNHNAFLRKNIHQTFTTDIFSALNDNKAGSSGFHSRWTKAVQAANGKKAEKGQVVWTNLSSKRRITKKGKKNNIKAKNWTVGTKTVASKKAIGHACDHLAARGVRLHQAALRTLKLNKQNK